MTEPMPKQISIGDKYDPAMKITNQAEANAYFERCVQHTMSFGTDRQEAERIERANLGYYAGYSSEETRRRVERLFSCAHPIFGAISVNGVPSNEEALEAGFSAGQKDPSQ